MISFQPCLGALAGWISVVLLTNAWGDRSPTTDVNLPVLAKFTQRTKHGLRYLVAFDNPVPTQLGLTWDDRATVDITRRDFERLVVDEAHAVLRYKPGYLHLPWRVQAALAKPGSEFSEAALAEAVRWGDSFNLNATDDVRPTGEVRRELYPDGRVRSEEPIVDGQVHGIAMYRFADGRLYGKIPYRQGKKHGRFTLYHENGTRDQTLSYREGELHGICEWFDGDGHPTKKWIYVGGRAAKELSLSADAN